MKKKIMITTIGLIVLIGILGGIKSLQINRMIAHGKQYSPPPQIVTTAVAASESWESVIDAVGSLTAVQGVTVTAELPGKVMKIGFTPGAVVSTGDLLIQQDISSETAQLRAAEAEVALAEANFQRAAQLYKEKVIPRSNYDDAETNRKQAVAQADQIKAVIAKKTIRAPFSGRLGIRMVNLGQVINAGEPIVSLQSMDPIFADFLLPQHQLAVVRTGLIVRVKSDALGEETIQGRITALNPEVDAATRNIRIQATLANPDGRLRPGMFVNVSVVMPDRNIVLAIPATAVQYAPYSDSVFVVEEKKDENSGAAQMVLRQQFVRLGESRGDYVTVIDGLRPGETVVSTGVFKLRNGQTVAVDNALSPEFELKPAPGNG